MKDRFVGLLSEVQRPGVDKLLAWLEKTDFYTAPASANYHGACEGGLLAHSLAVHDILRHMTGPSFPTVKPELAIVCGLLHDLAKVNFYKTSTRNVKNEETGAWEKKPFYVIEDKFPMSHGSKSVYIINEFTHLSVEEAMCIHWHMGRWGADGYADQQSLSAAMNKYPEILAMQIADQAATFWEKK